jgi:hypothetical protein
LIRVPTLTLGLAVALVTTGCGGDIADLAPATEATAVSTATTAPPSDTTQAPSTTDEANTTTAVAETTTTIEATTTTAEAAPANALDFDDAMIERAIAEAAATPPEDLQTPGRDQVATALLVEEFTSSEIDLGGLELIVFPLDISKSFVLMLTDDSTALLETEGGFELIVAQLLESPSVARFNIRQLVMQHSTVDDEGPLVVTFAVAMSDLDEAVSNGTDIFDRIAVQAERPG